METSAAIADAMAVQIPALSGFLLPRYSPTLAILAADSLAPTAAVRSDPYRHAPRALVRLTRRTRRRSVTGGGGDDAFSGDGDGDDGPFGGGGWGSGGPGGSGWDGSGPSPSPYSSDPAFDFVYEVICWIALSNCVLFGFKRIGRLLSERGKVLMPSIC